MVKVSRDWRVDGYGKQSKGRGTNGYIQATLQNEIMI
jgi:hypothetical protein